MSIFNRKSAGQHRSRGAVEVKTAGASAVQPAVRDTEPGKPKDRAQADGIGDRLDLGSLWIPQVASGSVGLETAEDQQSIVAVHVTIDRSAAQIQVFAAPKTFGIWSEVSSEIAEAVRAAGGSAESQSGPMGMEIVARMPTRGADGRTVFAPTRFIGADGPRWFVRAVLSGPAAVESAAAQPFYDLLADTVVVRGEGPMAPREPLPLRAPNLQVEAPALAEPKLNPFDRGPEISEVR